MDRSSIPTGLFSILCSYSNITLLSCINLYSIFYIFYYITGLHFLHLTIGLLFLSLLFYSCSFPCVPFLSLLSSSFSRQSTEKRREITGCCCGWRMSLRCGAETLSFAASMSSKLRFLPPFQCEALVTRLHSFPTFFCSESKRWERNGK